MATRRQKQERKKRSNRPAPPPRPDEPRVDLIGLATLAGLVGALLVSFASWQKIGFVERQLEDRIGRLEGRVAEAVERAPDAPSQPAQPARRGPDPNRVYEISTANRPVRGSAEAPVTIAEFSDFQ